MATSGTEGKILDVIARLGVATRGQISRAIGFSLDYVEYLLSYLVKKGYLIFARGRYFLPGQRRRKLITREPAKKRVRVQKKVKSSKKKKSRSVVMVSPFWWEKGKKKKK